MNISAMSTSALFAAISDKSHTNAKPVRPLNAMDLSVNNAKPVLPKPIGETGVVHGGPVRVDQTI